MSGFSGDPDAVGSVLQLKSGSPGQPSEPSGNRASSWAGSAGTPQICRERLLSGAATGRFGIVSLRPSSSPLRNPSCIDWVKARVGIVNARRPYSPLPAATA